MKRFFLYILFFSSIYISSQTSFELDTANYETRKKIVLNLKSDLDNLKKEFKQNYKKKVRNELDIVYTNLYNEFISALENKEFTLDKRFTFYIDSIKTKIIEENKLSNNIKILITKENSPNAVTVGKGIIIMNIGLFSYLENGDQLAAVLCHEFGHQVLKHSEKTILHDVQPKTIREKKKVALKLLRKKYNVHTELQNLLKETLYKDGKKLRKLEISADSIGYILYKKAKFKEHEYLRALEVLHEFETSPEITINKNKYKEIFNLPNQPFKDNWIKVDDENEYNYLNKEKFNYDSIKTHPELQERIQLIRNIFPGLESTSQYNKPTSNFTFLKKLSINQIVPSLYNSELYGLSAYGTFLKLCNDSNNSIHKKWLGKNFLKLYEAKKKYRFNRHVDRLEPNNQDKSYLFFLNFLWNLKLEEFKHISDYYLSKQEE
ncbi:peptidase M48-like protein [Tenacibaculum skagerrakense]|uniref:Peptidase M48-like protein n=1 Tax=Tenacibaculum skagerrakense TaxID=186571 RepID=A0A4R2NXD6_9FLAO|nr:M48 family metalloprotease [Tenacibaculum skagerrakense]TCP26800.1 peptidase M48-like protein [Tenacibaculum skagerrakense]